MRLDRWFRLLPALALGVGLTACPTEKDPTEPDEAPLAITTASLPNGTVGEPYSAGIDAAGGAGGYQWSIPSGSLPPGLSLEVDDLTDDDALITGIPTTEGTFAFDLRVSDDVGEARIRSYEIEVLPSCPTLCVENAALPPALVGAALDTQLDGAGGDDVSYSWSVEGGTLPTGLTLTSSGRLQGTPTATDTAVVVFRVSSGGLETEQAFTIQIVANRPGFNLTAAPVVPVPGAIQPALDAAIARWQAVITADVSQAAIPIGFFTGADCAGFGEVLNGTSADDIIILINIVPIDGPSQVLGQAGPCVVRSNDLPFAGVLTLDSDDLLLMSASEVTELIIHEIGHVLGFGSLWDYVDLLGGTTADPRFTGAAAIAEWNALGGIGQVPIENEGGQGTAGSHWRESVFDRELMTGFAEQSGIQPLSRVSIASLADLGYTVNLAAADPFALAAPMGVAGAALDRAGARGYDVVLKGTLLRVEADGSVTTIRRDTP